MTVLAYLSPEDASTGPANFVTGIKSQRDGGKRGVYEIPITPPTKLRGGVDMKQ